MSAENPKENERYIYSEMAKYKLERIFDRGGENEAIKLSCGSSHMSADDIIYFNLNTAKLILNAINELLDLSIHTLPDPTMRERYVRSKEISSRNMNALWSTGEDALLIHLYLEGMGIESIAIRMGRTASAMCVRLKKLGVHLERPNTG